MTGLETGLPRPSETERVEAMLHVWRRHALRDDPDAEDCSPKEESEFRAILTEMLAAADALAPPPGVWCCGNDGPEALKAAEAERDAIAKQVKKQAALLNQMAAVVKSFLHATKEDDGDTPIDELPDFVPFVFVPVPDDLCESHVVTAGQIKRAAAALDAYRKHKGDSHD